MTKTSVANALDAVGVNGINFKLCPAVAKYQLSFVLSFSFNVDSIIKWFESILYL